MTPEQLIKNARECERLQRHINTLEKESYLVVGKNCFFRESHGDFIYLTEEQEKLIRTITEAIRSELISQKKEQQQQLANPKQ